MSSFANPYKAFADGFLDYQTIKIYLYEGSVSAYLLNVAADTVKKATDPTYFSLVSE